MSTDNPIILPRRAVLAAGPSPVVDRCKRWLAADSEIDRLTERWALISGRRAEAAETEVETATVEARLEELRGQQAQGLRDIADAEAQDMRDVVGKLAVVAAALRDDGGPPHDIVIEALAMLAKRGA